MERKGLKSGITLASQFIQSALEKTFAIKHDNVPILPLISDKKGDFQSAFGNQIFNMYKEKNEEVKALGTPLKLVEKVRDTMLSLNNTSFDRIECNDKAFLFLSFSKHYLSDLSQQILTEGLYIENPEASKTIAIDFSSPNVAKEMHVGHLRSTIMGESTCRLFEYLGNTVHRINHIGDWGTQFGMLISHLFDEYPNYLETLPDLKDLESFYIAAKKRFDSDPEFKKRSQETVVLLQSGDAKCLKAWKVICDVSRGFFSKLYKRLDITNNEFGESFYNPMIPSVIQELEEKTLIKLDEGAKCFYIPGKEVPLMVQKSDGGYGYDTTDLAAAKYRLQTLKADRIIILTDVGQYPHFEMIFKAAFIAGWAVEGKHRLDHMGFGLIQNDKGGKMATREGGNVKLMSLLDEAKENAAKHIVDRMTGNAGDDEDKIEEKPQSTSKLSQDDIDMASEVMGVNAVKYFDLNQNRVQNYKFSYDKMLSPKGNTAVYLLYSYARINSIIEKAGVPLDALKDPKNFKITDEYEAVILSHIAKFCEVILGVANELNLNRLCAYIYDLSGIIASGYKKYKIVGNENTVHRVQILYITKLIFDKCFHILGIVPLAHI
jgi:arginyl-tRNA synthetase